VAEMFLTSLILLAAVSVDLFACAFAYGVAGKKLKIIKILVLGLINSVVLGVGLIIGHYVGGVIPADIAMWIGVLAFFYLGLLKIFFWEYNRTMGKKIEPVAKWWDVLLLSLALSFDCLVVGVGVAVVDALWVFLGICVGMSLLINIATFWGAQVVGEKIKARVKIDLGFISGLALIILSLLRLIF
jgi:putative Mn2+ efflux pump MntP